MIIYGIGLLMCIAGLLGIVIGLFNVVRYYANYDYDNYDTWLYMTYIGEIIMLVGVIIVNLFDIF